MKKIFNKMINYITEHSMTSFGDHVYRPRWFSVLSDYICFVSFGIIKPKRRPGEKCFGDMYQ